MTETNRFELFRLREPMELPAGGEHLLALRLHEDGTATAYRTVEPAESELVATGKVRAEQPHEIKQLLHTDALPPHVLAAVKLIEVALDRVATETPDDFHQALNEVLNVLVNVTAGILSRNLDYADAVVVARKLTAGIEACILANFEQRDGSGSGTSGRA